jgi:hypothetical protein
MTHRDTISQSYEAVDIAREPTIKPSPKTSVFIAKTAEGAHNFSFESKLKIELRINLVLAFLDQTDEEDAELGKFLMKHFNKDLFEISTPKDSLVPLWRLIK